jgi:hypothetical protein
MTGDGRSDSIVMRLLVQTKAEELKSDGRQKRSEVTRKFILCSGLFNKDKELNNRLDVQTRPQHACVMMNPLYLKRLML